MDPARLRRAGRPACVPVKTRLAVVVTLCLALGLAGTFGFPPEISGARPPCCGQAESGKFPGGSERAPAIPSAVCCPFCACVGAASLPDADGLWVRWAVARRAPELIPAADARRYPPPIPPPRARAAQTDRFT